MEMGRYLRGSMPMAVSQMESLSGRSTNRRNHLKGNGYFIYYYRSFTEDSFTVLVVALPDYDQANCFFLPIFWKKG